MKLLMLMSVALVAASLPAAEWVLVHPDHVTPQASRGWKAEGFSGTVLLIEETNAAALRVAAEALRQAAMPFYYWFEVGRSPSLAAAHPEWMASLGMHNDWQRDFTNVFRPNPREVVKAFPWVPIHYKQAFEAHVGRARRMLHDAPGDYAGVLLNHLQGGPSSCGCGNSQCRWAIDYHVSATGTPVGPDAPAQFLRAIQNFTANKPAIPVWTTECEHEDLPASKRAGGKSTGLCGTVGCATGACPKEFAKQWENLTTGHGHPVALLALHREFARTNLAFAHGPAWIPQVLGSLDETLRKESKSFPRARTWLVVQGATRDEERAARKAAAATGVMNVITSRVRLDQSFEPRVIPVGQLRN